MARPVEPHLVRPGHLAPHPEHLIEPGIHEHLQDHHESGPAPHPGALPIPPPPPKPPLPHEGIPAPHLSLPIELPPSHQETHQFVNETFLEHRELAPARLSEKLFESLQVPAGTDRLHPVIIAEGIAISQPRQAEHPVKTVIHESLLELAHQQEPHNVSEHTQQNVEALERAFKNVDTEMVAEGLRELL